MNKPQTLREATLVGPTFSGDDGELHNASQAWLSLVSAVGFCSPTYGIGLSNDNAKAIYRAIIALAGSKLGELETATGNSPECQPETGTMEIDFTMESQTTAGRQIRRMRELAGIPHTGNRV